jgi:hypothetical protein
MFMHPDLIWIEAKYRQQELLAEAERHRLLSAGRRARRDRKRDDRADRDAVAPGRTAGNLAACPPHAAAPAPR